MFLYFSDCPPLWKEIQSVRVNRGSTNEKKKKTTGSRTSFVFACEGQWGLEVCAFTRFDHPEMIFPSFACSIRRDARLSADLVHSSRPLGLSSALVPPERVIIWKLPQVSTVHSPARIVLIALISLISLIAPTSISETTILPLPGMCKPRGCASGNCNPYD